MSAISSHMISRGQLAAIAAKHGLPAPDRLPLPWTGATSRVYPLGDIVLKVAFDRPDAVAAVEIDAVIATFARGLDIAVPELIAFDAARDVVPVPFAIYRRIDGISIDPASRTDAARAAWHEVGRQLARVHAVADRGAVPVALRKFRQSPEVDPRAWVDELAEAGWLTGDDARWLWELLDRLAPAALADVPLALCHGDVNVGNVLVDAGTGAFRALIDWAGAGWLDPVWDFAGVPVDVVPWLLAGHREVAPLPADATAEARVLWCQVQTRLHAVRGTRDANGVREKAGSHVERLRRGARALGLW